MEVQCVVEEIIAIATTVKKKHGIQGGDVVTVTIRVGSIV
jgi:hypothetical protein